MEKIELSSMYGRFGKKKYKWNWKKCVKNISTLVLIMVLGLGMAYGLLWGMEQEFLIQDAKVQSHLEEVGGRK